MNAIRDYAIRDYVIKPSPLNPGKSLSESLNTIGYGNIAENFKKGGKIKTKHSKKKETKMSQVQKININIGDYRSSNKRYIKKYGKKKSDTSIGNDKAIGRDRALLLKETIYQPQPQVTDSTYLRLQSQPFKYMAPLPSNIPFLYQATPASIAQPLTPSKPIGGNPGDYQPKIHNPIITDTDPNDISASSTPHSTRFIPSFNTLSGSVSGIVTDPSSSSSSSSSYVPPIPEEYYASEEEHQEDQEDQSNFPGIEEEQQVEQMQPAQPVEPVEQELSLTALRNIFKQFSIRGLNPIKNDVDRMKQKIDEFDPRIIPLVKQMQYEAGKRRTKEVQRVYEYLQNQSSIAAGGK